MASSSYNCDHPRGVMAVKASKPKASKVIKRGKAPHFVPTKMPVAFSTQGGTKK